MRSRIHHPAVGTASGKPVDSHQKREWDGCKVGYASLKLSANSLLLDVGSRDGKKARYIAGQDVTLIMVDHHFLPLEPFIQGHAVVADSNLLPFRNQI